MHQFIIYIGSDDILRKFGFVFGTKCYVRIAASDEDNRLILMFACESVNSLYKILLGLDTGV